MADSVNSDLRSQNSALGLLETPLALIKFHISLSTWRQSLNLEGLRPVDLISSFLPNLAVPLKTMS